MDYYHINTLGGQGIMYKKGRYIYHTYLLDSLWLKISQTVINCT